MANPLAALALVVLCAFPLASHAAQTLRPAWSELTASQRSVLAALEPQWN